VRMLSQADIKQMTIPERMEAIDSLWVSIVEAGGEVSSPEWHKEILQERMARVKAGKAKFYTIDEARQKLQSMPK
jgi:putative addiction module component (TIGR02574 family)